jgi:catechol 2,3-dioxygenase-like lactoylglutathione lyase family enzyme
MFGRFLELGIATTDIAGSVQFYERLGFSQLITGDAWSHRYGVLGDGRLHLGLHERVMPSPTLTFVLPQLAGSQQRLRAAKFEPELTVLGDDSMHQLRLRDPAGHAVTLLEARTYSPAAAGTQGQSLCGYFSHLSLPQDDYQAAREFWERAGFVALPAEDQPFPYLPLTSDHLDLGFHARGTFDAPMLVFECPELGGSMARLRDLSVPLAARQPRGLDRKRGALIEAPDDIALLLLQAAG